MVKNISLAMILINVGILLPCAVGGEALFNIYENKGLSLINKEIKNGFKIIKRPLK